MNRKQPKNLVPPAVKKWNDSKQERVIDGKKVSIHTIGGTEVIVQHRQYKLLTPLFGGGVEPSENDPDNLIRGTEIRGQLRFWWRAIRGNQPEFEGKLEKMKAREDEIWGAASNTSKTQKKDAREDKPDERKWRGPVQILVSKVWKDEDAQQEIVLPSYAAFPLTDQDGSMQKQAITSTHKGISLGVNFELSLTYSIFSYEKNNPSENVDMQLEVNAALWAWENFGGIGARTRRGFGAIQLEAINAVPYTGLLPGDHRIARSRLTEQLEHYKGKGQYPEDVPHIVFDRLDTRHLLVLEPGRDVLETWTDLIERFQSFRRKPPYSSTNFKQWPEARAIREINSTKEEQKMKDFTQRFPRSTFGLPIAFYFGDDENLGKISLEGEDQGRERLASSLILRPLACQGKKTLGLALLLEGSRVPLEGLDLVKRDNSESEKKSLNPIPIHPAESDKIRFAFMDYLLKNYGKKNSSETSSSQRGNPDNRGKRS